MHVRPFLAAALALGACASSPGAAPPAAGEKHAAAKQPETPRHEKHGEREKFAETFHVARGDLASSGTNPFFVLEPGCVLEFDGKEGGRPHHLAITVLPETKQLDGVETRVVEERETEGGELSEVSRNYFAISRKDHAVYYFGEDVDEYEDGRVVKHGGSWHTGSWHAGENGARFGMMMPGEPAVGARFHQEHAPGVAMDRSEIVSVTETIETPAGRFEGCVKVEETSPLEKGREFKWYARGVGLVRDGGLSLVSRRAAER